MHWRYLILVASVGVITANAAALDPTPLATCPTDNPVATSSTGAAAVTCDASNGLRVERAGAVVVDRGSTADEATAAKGIEMEHSVSSLVSHSSYYWRFDLNPTASATAIYGLSDHHRDPRHKYVHRRIIREFGRANDVVLLEGHRDAVSKACVDIILNGFRCVQWEDEKLYWETIGALESAKRLGLDVTSVLRKYNPLRDAHIIRKVRDYQRKEPNTKIFIIAGGVHFFTESEASSLVDGHGLPSGLTQLDESESVWAIRNVLKEFNAVLMHPKPSPLESVKQDLRDVQWRHVEALERVYPNQQARDKFYSN